MPESRRRKDLLPNIANTWDGRFEQRQLIDFARVLGGVGISHHQADVVTDKIDLPVAKAFHKFVNVYGYRLFVVPSRRTGGIAETAHVRSNDRVVISELVKKRNPH